MFILGNPQGEENPANLCDILISQSSTINLQGNSTKSLLQTALKPVAYTVAELIQIFPLMADSGLLLRLPQNK
jgi:hypothetical protein